MANCKLFLCVRAFVVGSFVISACSGLRASEPASSDAPSLVQAALQAQSQGDASEHGQLLSRAVQADPEYAPARWQNGQVLFEGQWRTPTEVAEITSKDARWQEYRELRDASRGTPRDHEALARWCMRRGLSAEERYHWSHVLLAAPEHKMARRRLNVREYRGGLFTEEQIAEHERQAKQEEANTKRYAPQFIELVRQARGEGAAAREKALAEIRSVSDSGAIEALRAAITRDKRPAGDLKTRQLHLAVVAALGNMPEHKATLYLLNYALYSRSEEIRLCAAEALRPRKATDYVPLLMAALRAPIEAEFDVVAAPGGTVRMMATLHQPGPVTDAAHVQSVNFEVEGVQGGDPTTDVDAVRNNHLRRASGRAATTMDRVESYNRAIARRNARIQETLKVAAGMDMGTEPEKYWRAWSNENELYYSDENPVYETYDEETYTYYYEPAEVYDPSNERPQVVQPRTGCECFAPGTPVWTQSGPTPIERIVVGDFVLAQHPTTGELAYRPVLETSVGPPVPVVRLVLQGESFIATPGHRFWVHGDGWQMAKAMRPAMRLHALNELQDVTAIEKAESISCHNLVVDGFHTYFVGEAKLLVHDMTCPQPTTAQVPGLTSPLLEADALAAK